MSLNTSYGQSALGSNTTGNYNTALGSGSLSFSTSGSNNTAVGSSALDEQTTGNNNVAVGAAASLLNNGDNNVVVGTNALSNSVSGSNNVVVGNDSGTQYTSYNYNTLLGADTDIAVSDVQYATAIGYGAVADASNTIVLGGNSSGSYPVVSALGGVETSSVNFNYPSTPPTLVSNNLGSYVKLINNTVTLNGSTYNNLVNINNLPAGYWYITINLWANSLGNGTNSAATFITFSISTTNSTVIYNSYYVNEGTPVSVSQPQFIPVAYLATINPSYPSTGNGGTLLNHTGNAYLLSNGNGGFTLSGLLNGGSTFVGNVGVNYIAIRIA